MKFYTKFEADSEITVLLNKTRKQRRLRIPRLTCRKHAGINAKNSGAWDSALFLSVCFECVCETYLVFPWQTGSCCTRAIRKMCDVYDWTITEDEKEGKGFNFVISIK